MLEYTNGTGSVPTKTARTKHKGQYATVPAAMRDSILSMLERVCKRDGEYAKYNVGWDDAKLADHLKTTPHAVSTARISHYGKIRVPASRAEHLQKINKKIAHEPRLQALEARILEDGARITMLEQELTQLKRASANRYSSELGIPQITGIG